MPNNDWLTQNYTKLVSVVRDIGRDACDEGALDPEKFRLTMSARRDLIKQLRDEGWSMKRIAARQNIAERTARRDIQFKTDEERIAARRAERPPRTAKAAPLAIDYKGNDIDEVELKRITFLDRCYHHLSLKYDGPVDKDVVAAAEKVAHKWANLVQRLKEGLTHG